MPLAFLFFMGRLPGVAQFGRSLGCLLSCIHGVTSVPQALQWTRSFSRWPRQYCTSSVLPQSTHTPLTLRDSGPRSPTLRCTGPG